MQTVDDQYKPETESATMMGTCGTSVPELKSPANNSEEIQKTRKLLLSVISYFIVSIFDYYSRIISKIYFLILL